MSKRAAFPVKNSVSSVALCFRSSKMRWRPKKPDEAIEYEYRFAGYEYDSK
jgi:hypothetical protein